MHFKHHNIRHQRFTHTRLWPCSQRSSPVAQNSRTANDDWTLWKLGNEATSQSALEYITAFSTVWHTSTNHRQSDDASWFVAAIFTSGVGCCAGIVEPFKHICATTHPQLLVLELWALMSACPGWYGNIRFFLWLCYVNTSEHSIHKQIQQYHLCSMYSRLCMPAKYQTKKYSWLIERSLR